MGKPKQVTYSVKDSQFGSRSGHLLENLVGQAHCQIATATCRFTVQGPDSVGVKGKNWGEWIRTTLCTWGDKPRDGLVWQIQGHYATGDGHANMGSILGCFGLTCNDVFALFGHPSTGATYKVTLRQIVAALNPDLVPDDQRGHAVQRQAQDALVPVTA